MSNTKSNSLPGESGLPEVTGGVERDLMPYSNSERLVNHFLCKARKHTRISAFYIALDVLTMAIKKEGIWTSNSIIIKTTLSAHKNS